MTTALFKAAKNGHTDICKFFIKDLETQMIDKIWEILKVVVTPEQINNKKRFLELLRAMPFMKCPEKSLHLFSTVTIFDEYHSHHQRTG